jgi:nitrogen fixation-related uncharacterized protein
MNWIQILISIPVAIVAVAFVRVGWLVAKDMEWFSPIRSDWRDIPIGLRIKYQGGAFLIYLISGCLRALLFGAALASGWLALGFRREPSLAGIGLLGVAICLSMMWADAQAQYEDERRRGPRPKDLD